MSVVQPASVGVEHEALASYNGWPEGIDDPIFVGDVVLIPPGAAIPTG
jgi:hypothetical protein